MAKITQTAHTQSALRLAAARAASALNAKRGLHRYSLLAVLMLAFVGLVTFVAPTDPDVWWHLKNGELILTSGIPTQDVYSYTAAGREWIVQEWLTEAAMYAIKSAFGYGALSLLFGMLQAFGGLLVYLLLRRMGAGRLLALLMLLVYFVFAAPTWGVRPQVLSAVYIAAFYLVLALYKKYPSRSRLLWLTPPLMLLWVNTHASFFMGIAVLGAFIVGEWANNWLYRPDTPTPLRPLLATLAACLGATLLNPYFINLWTYPLTYLLHGTSSPLLRYTQEWQPPNFREPSGLLFGLTIVLLALVGVTRPAAAVDRQNWRWGLRRRVDVSYAIVLAAFTLLALQAVRLVPLYGVIALPLLAGGLGTTLPVLAVRRETPPSPAEGRINWLLAPVAALAMAFFVLNAPQAQTGDEPRTDAGFQYPVGGANYIANLNEPVKMFNDFAWGGYLIHRLYPKQKVFIDGRADMYREGIFEDFITVQNVQPQWRDILDRYGVNLVLLPPNTPLGYALDHEVGWKATYKDGASVVYRSVGTLKR